MRTAALGVAVLAASLLMVGACGDGSQPAATPAPETTVVPKTAPSTPPESLPPFTGSTPTTAAPSTTAAVAADAAPDFVLELGNGGTFVLSEEARPVFMVFWAEW